MKTLIALLLLSGTALAGEVFYPLVLSNNLALPTWATNFFTANASLIPSSGAATTIATNGGTGWGTTLISPYLSGGTNSTPLILQPTIQDDITLSDLTASTVPVLNSSKVLVSSAVTATELGYLSGVTATVSDAQTSAALTYSGGTNITVTVPTTGAPHVISSLAVTNAAHITFSGSNVKATGEVLLTVASGTNSLSFAGNVLKPAATSVPISLTTGTWNLEWKQRSIGGTNFTVLNVLQYDTP